jgi:hypothetical protein
MRWTLLLLLMSGCSVELDGLATRGVVQDNGSDDDLLDARVIDDASADEGDGDTGDDDDAAPGDGDGEGAESHDDGGSIDTKSDASMPGLGYQPPAGQIGSRCQTNECALGGSGVGGYCAMTGQPPIGSDTGYCTRSCGSGVGTACGQGSICVTVNSVSTCQRTCADDSDCRIEDGYYCASSFPLLLHVCWHH